ncbi:MAG TPA: hypothetical protein PKW35_02310 [Nannocystaceae bacterium]|nr:hypothetical protein [Nannocystaceae bacterium]
MTPPPDKVPVVAAAAVVAATAAVLQVVNPWAFRYLDEMEQGAEDDGGTVTPAKSAKPANSRVVQMPTQSLGSFTLANALEGHGPYRMGRRYGIDLDAWLEKEALKIPEERRLEKMWEYRERRSAEDHSCLSLYFSQEEWYSQESNFDHEQAWKLHVMHLLDRNRDTEYWVERTRKRRELKESYEDDKRTGRGCHHHEGFAR